MKLRNIFTLAALCLSTSVACAQMALPKTQIGGVEFYRYDTSAGESIYDIAAKLGVTKDYIIQNNPDAADGITSGMALYFPVEGKQGVSSSTSSPSASTTTHVVEQGETLYGLAKKYGVTIDELIALNPGSDKGIKVGQKLNVPSATSAAQNTGAAHQQVVNAFSGINDRVSKPLVIANHPDCADSTCLNACLAAEAMRLILRVKIALQDQSKDNSIFRKSIDRRLATSIRS